MRGRNIRAGHSSSSSGAPASVVAGLPAAAGFAWCAGACLALWSAWRPGEGVLWVAAVTALLAAAAARPRLACLVAGFVASGAVAERQLERRWPGALDGQRVLVEGRIDGLPWHGGASARFDFEGEIVAPAPLGRPVRLRVLSRDATVAPRAGERWRLLLRLGAPRAALNPGGSDGERFLFAERIDALAVVVPSRLARRLEAPAPGWDVLRESIAARIRESVVDRDAAALIAGLAVGATADMSREQWRVFGATGTVHLVAISGLHVTMFAWLATRAARWAWRRARLGHRVEREPFAAGCGLLCAAAYALLAGFGVPTQRTLVMLAVWWAARLAGRRAGGIEVIGLALLAVLAFDPLAPLAAGFWLSFAAIAVLIATESGAPAAGGPAGARRDAALPPRAGRAAPRRAVAVLHGAAARVLYGAVARGLRSLWALLVTQCRITLALAPATLLLFGSVPLAGLLANLVAIPLFSVLLVPLILAALAAWPLSAGLAGAGWRLAEQLYLWSWPLLEALSALPGANWSREPPVAWLPVALLALPLGALPLPWTLRATALAAALPLLGPPLPPPGPGEFHAMLLETGDGTALLVLTRTHALLYDTGDVYGSDGARAATVVLPALRSLGRDRLDLVVQSRATGFRVAGVANLLATAPVHELRSGGEWTAGPRPRVDCASESGWIWDDVEIRVFPAVEGPGATGGAPLRDGGASCLLRVAAARGRGPALLVPGQVDAAEALHLAGDARPGRLRADAVLAPRRGSSAALTPGFVAAVGARHVLVASRELTAARRARIARDWGVEPFQVRGTAVDGALRVVGRPRATTGDRPRVSAAAPGVQVAPWLDGQRRWIWRVPRD